MKIIACLFFFCFSMMTVDAQQNLEAGYIINRNQDTVKGFIQPSMEADLASSVHFKNDLNGQFKVYTPYDLIGFGFEKDIYRSLHFLNNSGDSDIAETAFVKQLVGGEYNLYSYLKTNRTFYLIQKDTSIYFLYDRVTSNMGEDIKEGNYLNYLSFISSTCKQLGKQYERVQYDDKKLAEFVFESNNCISGKAVNYYQKPKTTMEPIIFVGGLPLGDESQFTADFSLRFTFPKLDIKTSFNIGVHFSSTKKKEYYGGTQYYYLQKDQIVSVPLTIQYNMLTGRVQPYLYGGFSGAYLKETTNQDDPYPKGPNFGLAIVAGLGIEVRIIKGLFFKADWRYELILQYPAIGISYRF